MDKVSFERKGRVMDESMKADTLQEEPMGIIDAMGVMDLITDIAGMWDKKMKDWLREYNITHSQFNALVIFKEKGSQTPGELSKMLSCTPCNVTGIVDRLEQGGLVTRERSDQDRRVVDVALTEKGRALAADLEKAALPELTRLNTGVLGKLDAEEIQLLHDALPKLLGGITES
ncbi:MAG: MarR family transcriptional regulator [Actinobacteria bacterium]|nr:MarR family transcriptional regulator [Actinomycetota bacterium]